MDPTLAMPLAMPALLGRQGRFLVSPKEPRKELGATYCRMCHLADLQEEQVPALRLAGKWTRQLASTQAQVGIGLSLLQDLVGGMGSDSDSGYDYDDSDDESAGKTKVEVEDEA